MAYDILTCQFCLKTFKQEKRFIEHLHKDHGVEDHFKLYLDTYYNGIHPTCSCSTNCKEKLSWYSWKKGFTSKFVRGHNATIDSVFKNESRRSEFISKRVQGYKDKRYSVWNLGLTKDNDDRIKQSVAKSQITRKKKFKTGELIAWQKKKPIEWQQVKKQRSITMKGSTPWNKGKTKNSDARLLKIGKSISKSLALSKTCRLNVDELKIRIEKYSSQFELLSDLNLYKNKYHKFTFKCKVCDSIMKKSLPALETTPVCFNCHPKESKGQLELFEYVSSIFDEEVILCDRKAIHPKELDIFIPTKNIGIEFDGLLWHSDKFCSKQSSLAKYDLCKKNTVNLVRIFEDEWNNNQQLVKDEIKRILGIEQQIIDYDNCELIEFNNVDFIKQNSLQMFDEEFDKCFSLRCNKEIICVFTFKFVDEKMILINNHSSTSINNLKYIIENLKKQFTVDCRLIIENRLFIIDDFLSLGFSILEINKENFQYTDFINRYDSKNLRQVYKIFGIVIIALTL